MHCYHDSTLWLVLAVFMSYGASWHKSFIWLFVYLNCCSLFLLPGNWFSNQENNERILFSILLFSYWTILLWPIERGKQIVVPSYWSKWNYSSFIKREEKYSCCNFYCVVLLFCKSILCKLRRRRKKILMHCISNTYFLFIYIRPTIAIHIMLHTYVINICKTFLSINFFLNQISQLAFCEGNKTLNQI